MNFRYIPMIAKKEPSEIFVETIHSYFYHSFPPFIEYGKLTFLGIFAAVSLSVSIANRIIRCFLRHD